MQFAHTVFVLFNAQVLLNAHPLSPESELEIGSIARIHQKNFRGLPIRNHRPPLSPPGPMTRLTQQLFCSSSHLACALRPRNTPSPYLLPRLLLVLLHLLHGQGKQCADVSVTSINKLDCQSFIYLIYHAFISICATPFAWRRVGTGEVLVTTL